MTKSPFDDVNSCMHRIDQQRSFPGSRRNFSNSFACFERAPFFVSRAAGVHVTFHESRSRRAPRDASCISYSWRFASSILNPQSREVRLCIVMTRSAVPSLLGKLPAQSPSVVVRVEADLSHRSDLPRSPPDFYPWSMSENSLNFSQVVSLSVSEAKPPTTGTVR